LSKIGVSAVAIAALATGVFFAGCGRRTPTATLPEAQDEFAKKPLVKSQSIQVDFYIDSSTPLRGFLVPGKGERPNYFLDVLNKAPDILSETWFETSMKYWRFGAGEPAPVASLLAFKNPSQFSDLKTYIEKPIRQQTPHAPGAPQLKIILTDLFQNDNAVGSIAKDLDDRYLKDTSQAVGILGVRSPFSGPMDDLPGKAPATAADSLPFYLLMAGPVADVRVAIRRLVDGIPIAPKDHFEMIFGHRIVDTLSRPLALSPAQARVGFELNPGLVPGARDRKIAVLGNVRHDVTVKLDNFPDPDLMNLGPFIRAAAQPESIKVQAIAFTQTGKPGAPDPQAASAARFLLDGKAKTMTIDRSKLRSGAMYLFQLDLMAEQASIGPMERWGLESEERDRVVSRGEFDKDENGNRPGKTPNLRHFLNILSLKMFQSDIRLARYYFYVEAK
jgi:hypothetical protein